MMDVLGTPVIDIGLRASRRRAYCSPSGVILTPPSGASRRRMVRIQSASTRIGPLSASTSSVPFFVTRMTQFPGVSLMKGVEPGTGTDP